VDALSLRVRELMAERYLPVPRITAHERVYRPITPEQAAANWYELQRAVEKMDLPDLGT
jgi:hypothetical protein